MGRRKKKKKIKEESNAAPCDTAYNTCQSLQSNLGRKACFAVLCCRYLCMRLFDFTLRSHTDPNLPSSNKHGLVWDEAIFIFFFSPKNLISCMCRSESCSFMDAAHVKRNRTGKMVRVSSLIYRISINPGTRGRVTYMWPPPQQDVFVGALLVRLQVQNWECAAAWQPLCSRSSSSADPWWFDDVFQKRFSHAGCPSIPPNCGRRVWLRYQLVWGMAGRQERIKRGYKEKMEVRLCQWWCYFTALVNKEAQRSHRNP